MAKDQAALLKAATGYLKGKVEDSETVVGEDLNNDIVQFFVKLMNLAGISPNGTFDNETNGYQFIDALKAITTVNPSWITGTLEDGWSGLVDYFKTNDGIVHVRIRQIYHNTGFSASGRIFWLPPVGYRPFITNYQLVVTQGTTSGGTTHRVSYGAFNDFQVEAVPDAVPAGTSSNSITAYLVYKADA